MTITKDSSISFPINHKGTQYLWNEAPTWDVDANNVMTIPRTRTGTRLPHYREIIAKGENATTALSAQECSLDYNRLHGTYELWKYQGNPAQFCYRKNEGDTFIRNDQFLINFSDAFLWSDVGDISLVDDLAKAAFLRKLKSAETLFQGQIFLGELGETLKMLRNPLVGIRSLAKDFLGTLRKRKRANPKKWLNDIGSAWLEQSFGWNPLINDVQSAVKAYRQLVKPVQTFKISAGASKSYDGTSTKSSAFKPGINLRLDGGCTFHTISSWYIEQLRVRYKGALITQVGAPPWRDDDLFGWKPQNFIPTAWELLPWSFLADYFTNIGDILDASIVNTQHLAWCNVTTTRTKVKHGLFEQIWGSPPGGTGWTKVAMSNSLGHHFAKKKIVSRSANVDLLSLNLLGLHFNFDLTGGQLANIDALLSQASALHPQHNPRNWHR